MGVPIVGPVDVDMDTSLCHGLCDCPSEQPLIDVSHGSGQGCESLRASMARGESWAGRPLILSYLSHDLIIKTVDLFGYVRVGVECTDLDTEAT